ncbi:MAG: flagellar biosynthetic protein FliQ [Roseomonas sp.]|nr:flagellar biosynthetic protein FliQ [Roseomonas sp.]
MEIIVAGGQQALWASLLIGGPLLGLLLVVGLTVSVLQALTQVQEPSVSFVPKLVSVALLLAIGAPMATGIMQAFAQRIFALAVVVGG